MNLCREVSELVTVAVQGCAFGIDSTGVMLDFTKDGITEKVPLGDHFRRVLGQFMQRSTCISRLLFDAFDEMYFGKSEKEALENSRRLRGYI
jgi:hypothetical protein